MRRLRYIKTNNESKGDGDSHGLNLSNITNIQKFMKNKIFKKEEKFYD